MNEAPPPKPNARLLQLVREVLAHASADPELAPLLRGAALLETPPSQPATLAADLLRGAAEIAVFLYGDKKHRAKVYRLVAAGKLPHFRIGSDICSRKSVLLNWVKTKEVKSFANC